MTEIDCKNIEEIKGYGHIYMIINMINGMSYIGYTKRTDRVSRGIDTIKQVIDNYRKCVYLYNAMMNHGIENFKEKMIEDNILLNIIHERENYWMWFYDTMHPNGYNLVRGEPYCFVSEELKERLRKLRKKWWDEHPENKIEMGNLQKRLFQDHPEKWERSEETNHRVSESFKGENNPFYGKHHTEETKNILREKSIKRYQEHPELLVWSEKRKSHHKEAMNRLDVKDKISKSTKGENNPFYGKIHTNESKKKMSESQERWRNKRSQEYERSRQENDFTNMRKKDLYELAKNSDVKDRSYMNKKELIEYFINLNKNENEK